MNRPAVEAIRDISPKTEVEGVTTGTIGKIDEDGAVFVDFPDNRKGLIRARLTATVAAALAKQMVAGDAAVLIAFEKNDADRPVIIDVIRDRIDSPGDGLTVDRNDVDDVRIDGETVTFDAKKEIVLRCGKSSITLTRAGKVLIRGTYLLNRSSGVNRIKGGSVQIN